MTWIGLQRVLLARYSFAVSLETSSLNDKTTDQEQYEKS